MKKYAPNMTGSVGSMTAYALAKLCYDTIVTYGLAAKTSCEAHVVTPAFEHIVEASTLLSGLGFESGGLAAADAIHNGLTVLEETHRCYHGEKVAIGVLASLFLTDKPPDISVMCIRSGESVGLPTTLEDIGLGAPCPTKNCTELLSPPAPRVKRSITSLLRSVPIWYFRR